MTHTLAEAVHVDIRVGNETFSDTYGPGNVELPDPVAELLVAQGLATPTVKASKKSPATQTDPTTTEA